MMDFDEQLQMLDEHKEAMQTRINNLQNRLVGNDDDTVWAYIGTLAVEKYYFKMVKGIKKTIRICQDNYGYVDVDTQMKMYHDMHKVYIDRLYDIEVKLHWWELAKDYGMRTL